MKASNHFKNTIKTYLDQRAETDVLFSFQYSKPEKNIDECIQFILNTVQKSGCNGFGDDEIFGMAVHYYDENEIDIGKPINCQIAVNHVVELTQEEKEEAHKKAIQLAQEEAYNKLKQPLRKSNSKQIASTNQLTLF